MSNTIKIKRRVSGSGSLGALAVGELGVNIDDNNKLYVGTSAGNKLTALPTSGGILSGALTVNGTTIINSDFATTGDITMASSGELLLYGPINGTTAQFSGAVTASAVTLTGDITSGNTTTTALFSQSVRSGAVVTRLTANSGNSEGFVGTNSAHDFLLKRNNDTKHIITVAT